MKNKPINRKICKITLAEIELEFAEVQQQDYYAGFEPIDDYSEAALYERTETIE